MNRGLYFFCAFLHLRSVINPDSDVPVGPDPERMVLEIFQSFNLNTDNMFFIVWYIFHRIFSFRSPKRQKSRPDRIFWFPDPNGFTFPFRSHVLTAIQSFFCRWVQKWVQFHLSLTNIYILNLWFTAGNPPVLAEAWIICISCESILLADFPDFC